MKGEGRGRRKKKTRAKTTHDPQYWPWSLVKSRREVKEEEEEDEEEEEKEDEEERWQEWDLSTADEQTQMHYMLSGIKRDYTRIVKVHSHFPWIQFLTQFVDASSHLYKRVRQSVGLTVGPSLRPSVGWSVMQWLQRQLQLDDKQRWCQL